MKKAALIISLTLLGGLIAVVFLELRANSKEIQPPYPRSWNQISTGMTLDEIKGIIGPPTSDMSLLKTVDTWIIFDEGTKLELSISFDRNNPEGSIATGIFRHKKRDDIIYEKERFPWN